MRITINRSYLDSEGATWTCVDYYATGSEPAYLCVLTRQAMTGRPTDIRVEPQTPTKPVAPASLALPAAWFSRDGVLLETPHTYRPVVRTLIKPAEVKDPFAPDAVTELGSLQASA